MTRRAMVYEAGLAAAERAWPHRAHVVQRDNLASCYNDLGRHEEALRLHREIYAFETAQLGTTLGTLCTASNITSALCCLERYSEARDFASKCIREATRLLGADHDLTLRLRSHYVDAIFKHPDARKRDMTSAVETMERIWRARQRAFGHSHRTTLEAQDDLEEARAALAALPARETPSGSP